MKIRNYLEIGNIQFDLATIDKLYIIQPNSVEKEESASVEVVFNDWGGPGKKIINDVHEMEFVHTKFNGTDTEGIHELEEVKFIVDFHDDIKYLDKVVKNPLIWIKVKWYFVEYNFEYYYLHSEESIADIYDRLAQESMQEAHQKSLKEKESYEGKKHCVGCNIELDTYDLDYDDDGFLQYYCSTCLENKQREISERMAEKSYQDEMYKEGRNYEQLGGEI